MKNVKFIYVLLPVSILGVLLCCGCSQKKSPQAPKSRTGLVLEILKALEDHKHNIVLKKIERLRELDPTNVFLANLEILERNNVIIVQAQDQINKGDLHGALEKVKEGIQKYGRHKDLMIANQQLAVATRISELLDVFKKPRESKRLLEAALKLKEIGSRYKPAKIFLSLADDKITEAKAMNVWENKRAIDSFCSYIDTMLDKKDADVDILFAVLEVADPYNPTLLNYLDYMKGHDSLSLKTFEDDDVFSSDFSNSDAADDETSDDEKTTETQNELNDKETEIDNKTKETENNVEKKKGWWNKFSF